jgi:hypothetical protein
LFDHYRNWLSVTTEATPMDTPQLVHSAIEIEPSCC